MTTHDISLVRESFRTLSPIADQAAALFYARLFELDPSLRRLFHGDRETEGRHFIEMIGMAVASLDNTELITASFRQLGARHFTYGVRGEHYATVGTAFLWTLDKILGPRFSPEVKYAWSATYSLLANKMIEGGRFAGAAA
jgi:hemoglobin-like flavoprotein